MFFLFFFFNDTATTEIYTLSLHDALPIWIKSCMGTHTTNVAFGWPDRNTLYITESASGTILEAHLDVPGKDRKSTRLNSSHQIISYAVFCLKKKKNI